MTQFQREIGPTVAFLRAFMDFVLAWAAYGWAQLRDALDDSGLSPLLRTALMIAVAALAVLVLLRLLRGAVRLLLAAALALLAARALGWI
jgi:hypothetical protein